MITWFHSPYTVRLSDGFDYLMQGTFLSPATLLPMAILIQDDGTYTVRELIDVITEWRRDPKTHEWNGLTEEDD